MNSFRQIRFFLIVLLAGAACAFAETPANESAESVSEAALYRSATAGDKMAYVDMARLFNEYPGTQPAVVVLQKEMNQKLPERQALTAELERLLKNGGNADEIKAQRQKIIQYDQQVQVDMDARQTEVFAPIFESIESSVKDFGAKNGYGAIFIEPRDGAEDVTEAVLATLKK